MAVGFIAGAQQHLIASVKHLAANSIENTRFEVDVTLDARTLHEIYLPHFRASVVDAHVGSVMTAYNKVNGRYCAENCVLLRDILRGQWGFRGFVESDWIFGTRSTLASLQAGLDIEMPHANYYGRPLAEALRRGDVPERLIDEAVRRILRTKLAFGLDRPTPIDPGLVECDAHMELALEVAHKSIVLLKNDGDLLPLPETADQRLCVVGSLSDLENTGDRGSSMVRSSFVTTPLAGIRDHLPGARIDAIPRDELAAHEHALVEAADAVVVVVGLNYRDEGENIPFNEGGGDRTRLRLSDRQEQLIREVTRLNPRTVVVMLGGSAIEVRPWLDDVPALLMAFYPGMLGGEAISDLVFGRVCPSGRLPISFAREAGDYPPFDPTSKAVVYGYHHGYAHLLEQQKSAELCFGFGLSYTRFSYGEPELSCTELGPNESVELAIDVTNVGTRSGAEVVQVYASYAEGPTPRPSRRLVTFGRVELEPGHTARLCLRIDADDLCFYDPGAERFVLPSGACTLFVARNVAEPVHARTLTLRGER
jgi:beta-glucosidase